MFRSNPGVYVVDDERVIAETLVMILNRSGFLACAFDDPRRALAAATAGPPPDLLISDVVMPGMSGIELAIEFRRTFPGCRVLLFSGQAATANLLEVARSDGHNFEVLSKPIHPSDLLARLAKLPQNSEELETADLSKSRSAATG